MICEVKQYKGKWTVFTEKENIVRTSKKGAKEYALVLKHLYGYNEVVIYNEDGTVDFE